MILSCPSCKKRFLLDARLLGAGRRVKCGNCGHIWHQEPPPPERRAGAASGRPAAKPAPKPVPQPAPSPAPKPAQPRPAAPPPPTESPFEAFAAAMGASGFGDEGADDFSRRPDAEPEKPRPIPKGSNLPVPLDEGRSRRAAVLRWGGLALAVGAMVAGILLARPEIVKVWPASARLYEMIGMPVEPVGAGLAIPPEKTKVELRDIEGAKLLFVTGEVTNTSDATRPVPDILASALDATGKELFSWRMQPSARRLFPGQTATFESRVPERGGEAANIGFTFVEPEQPPPGT